MPLTGLAPLDSSWQPARFFVINDRRLQANRVDHRSFAGFSLHNLGSGQQVAAGARRRGRRSAHRSAVKFSCSAGTLTTPTLDAVPARARRLSVWGDIIRLAAISRAKPAAERCRATVEPNGCLSARASNGGFSGFCAERERARARFLTLRPAVSSFAGESLVRRWPGLDSSGTLRWRKGSLRSRS